MSDCFYSVEHKTFASWLEEYANCVKDITSKYGKEPYSIWRKVKTAVFDDNSNDDKFLIKISSFSKAVLVENNKNERIYTGFSTNCQLGEFIYDKLLEPEYITAPTLTYTPKNALSFDYYCNANNNISVSNSLDMLQEEVNRIKEGFKAINKNYSKDNKEKKMNNDFINFDFGPADENQFAISPYGIATYSPIANTWLVYNKETNEVIDAKIFHFDLKGFFYKIPTPISNISVGNIILHMGTPMFVKSVNTDNTITAVNYDESSVTTILPMKSPFGFNFVTKIISLMNIDNIHANKDNPFGSMLPFLMMKDSSIDPMMFFLMNQNNPLGDNPLLMYMLLDKDKNKDNLLPLILMMNGGVLPTT